ncbi:MAG: hypothetical protein L3J79_00540, partial [Candidatus Marinimicrobia bacterium]|nr:hypothetical protein [Candidatus Neomarinimicrobiota bacterium]
RIALENDLQILSSRITYVNEVVELDTSIQDTGLIKASQNPINLVLIAEVESPTVSGEVLQATDVYVKDNKASVAYNMIGEPFLGAVDVFNVRDEEDPELISSMYFTDSDVNGLAYKNNYLYLTMATDRAEFDSPAVVERVRIRSGVLTDETETFDIPSWAATDVAVSSHHLFVTSGAEGGQVTVIRLSDHEIEFSYPVEDARGVGTDDEEIAIIAGTPARLLTFNYESGELLEEFSLSGANIPFSKSTIEVYRRKAVVALGNGGVQIICLENGEVIEEIPPPVIPDLDESVTVANAATTSGKTLYMSNGEAGVYVAWSRDKFNSRNCEVDDIQMIGSFRFDDLQSVNHVKVKGNYLYVAGGLGGLKILRVVEEEDDD